MKRLIFDSKTCSLKFGDWKPEYVSDFGSSCVRKSKYVSDTVRINNNEVNTGTSRTALYTMPGGVDNGVRYSPLYESSTLSLALERIRLLASISVISRPEDSYNGE